MKSTLSVPAPSMPNAPVLLGVALIAVVVFLFAALGSADLSTGVSQSALQIMSDPNLAP